MLPFRRRTNRPGLWPALLTLLLTTAASAASAQELVAIQQKLQLLEKQLQSPIEPPIGAVVAFAGETPPPGWRLCNGERLTPDGYPALFAVLGYTYGRDEDGRAFFLPDYRGLFLRGADAGSERDPGRKKRKAMHAGGNEGDRLGSVQDDAVGPHTHAIKSQVSTLPVTAIIATREYVPLPGRPDAPGDSIETTDGGTGKETRPRNAYVNWIIRVQ